MLGWCRQSVCGLFVDAQSEQVLSSKHRRAQRRAGARCMCMYGILELCVSAASAQEQLVSAQLCAVSGSTCCAQALQRRHLTQSTAAS